MKAWLVTWEWAGDHAKVSEPVAAILNSRTSPDRVREIVEFLYANASYTLSERLACAKNKRNNPYPARFASIDGFPWQGQITCGHNPFLFARLVEGISVQDDGTPEGRLVWKEVSLQQIRRMSEAIKSIRSA